MAAISVGNQTNGVSLTPDEQQLLDNMPAVQGRSPLRRSTSVGDLNQAKARTIEVTAGFINRLDDICTEQRNVLALHNELMQIGDTRLQQEVEAAEAEAAEYTADNLILRNNIAELNQQIANVQDHFERHGDVIARLQLIKDVLDDYREELVRSNPANRGSVYYIESASSIIGFTLTLVTGFGVDLGSACGPRVRVVLIALPRLLMNVAGAIARIQSTPTMRDFFRPTRVQLNI